VRSIERLTQGPIFDVVLYLDERGTPGTERLFITGGVLIYGDKKAVADAWSRFVAKHAIRRRKGTNLSRVNLLDAAEFLIQQPILPVAIWSELTNGELERLKTYSDEYRRKKSPYKRAEKISPASWIWKHQMNQTIACAQGSFLVHIGRIGTAHAHIDQVTDQVEMRAHYKKLLEHFLTASRLGAIAPEYGASPEYAMLLQQASPEMWKVDLNATGPLAQLADITCAMFGRFRSGESQEPWDVVKLRYKIGDQVPVCIGGDITWSVRNYLRELYSSFWIYR